jgi:hypothetical protein
MRKVDEGKFTCSPRIEKNRSSASDAIRVSLCFCFAGHRALERKVRMVGGDKRGKNNNNNKTTDDER